MPAEKIEVIAHGIPDFPFLEPDQAKAKLGFSGKTVILTFGLLSPSKGIEFMIDAMPSILNPARMRSMWSSAPRIPISFGIRARPTATALWRAHGKSASRTMSSSSISSSIRPTLLDFISMCDVYVTPYLNESQMTSGTLAYSFGLGKAIVSTPYWHARELLADGRGILVPFADSAAIGSEIAELLTDDFRRQAMRKRAYAAAGR